MNNYIMELKLKIMKKFMNAFIALSIFIFGLINSSIFAQGLDDYKYNNTFHPTENTVSNIIQFNGYTNHWQDIYREWHHYGNLFKIGTPNVEYTIAQSKVDIAEDLQLPGLSLQEGFLNGLLTEQYVSLDQPSLQKLEEVLKQGNTLIFVSPESEVGKKLSEKLSGDNFWREKINSHQYNAKDFNEIKAFYLVNGKQKLFVVFSYSEKSRNQTKKLIENTKSLLSEYDLHRGWFGAQSLLKSVTCMFGHPLEVIGKGMNEGNTWFTFNGYMDFLMQNELSEWLAKAGNPVVADVGAFAMYGCENYDGLQVQDMGGKEGWINFAKKKGGYIFRPVYDPKSDPYHYDGYVAIEGNKEQIDNEDVPFIFETGSLQDDATSCMVLFIKKGDRLTKQRMWEAILDRREVAVLEQGKMMGPKLYRNILQMLLLDRIFLEEYFGDRIDMEAVVEDYNLIVTITNTYSHSVSGTLDITLPPELKLEGELSSSITLPAQSTKNVKLKIRIGPDAMDKTNPIAVHFNWGSKKKGTLTIMDMPRVISVHQLLYGHAPRVTYPVTIHNFSRDSSFPVQLQVVKKDKSNEVVYETTQICSANTGKFQDLLFDLKVLPGHYNVKVSTLGVENISQLGVGKPEGKPYVYEDDLNGDGVMEYRMENDSVRVTLLTTGARVIEYIVKGRNDNVLFKLWPRQAIDHKSPFRRRGYYPYGGFEDFLGQASMETHKVYDAEIVKKEGDYVRVRMTADYYGNKLEKTFTLYGNSPLLEVRFALTFSNPEANVIGPQPILELGKSHWTEDVFIVPTLNGLEEFRMRPEEYWGRVIHLKEGWNAGYDTKEDITFVGAYPVTEPLFLHMWMNHPSNASSHNYYAEFQPWVPIYQKSSMYFSYYIWGAGGPWENGVKELQKRNLITTH